MRYRPYEHRYADIFAAPSSTGWRFWVTGCECSPNAYAYHETLREAEDCARRLLFSVNKCAVP